MTTTSGAIERHTNGFLPSGEIKSSTKNVKNLINVKINGIAQKIPI